MVIEAHDSLDSLEAPYDFTTQQIFDDNRSIIRLLRLIGKELQFLRAAIRQEVPQPSIVTLPITGNTTRFHTDTLTITVTAACVVSLVTGATTERSWNFGGADTKVLDYPFVLENGKDYSLSATAGTVTGYFKGYTEVYAEPANIADYDE